MADETIGLVLDVEDGGSAAKVAADVQSAEKAVGRFVDASGRLREANGRFVGTGEAARKTADDLTVAEKAMDRTAAAADRAAGKGGGGGAAGLGQSLMQVGRVTQDFVSGSAGLTNLAGGLNAITNNVEGLAVSLGLGAGLGGAVTVAAVALQLLLPKIQEFIATIGGGAAKAFASEIDRVKDSVEELGKKPLKLEADWKALDEGKAKLDGLIKAQNTLNRLLGKQTSDEAESGQAVEAGLTDAKGRAALDRLKQASGDRAVEASPEVKAARAKAAKEKAALDAATDRANNMTEFDDPGTVAAERKIAERQHRAAQADADLAERKARTEGEGQVGTAADRAIAGTGKQQKEAREALAKAFGRAGNKGLAAYLDSVSPEGLAAGEMTPDEEAELNSGVTSGKKTAAANAKRRAFLAEEGKKADAMFRAQAVEGREVNTGPERQGLTPKQKFLNDNLAAMRAARTQMQGQAFQGQAAQWAAGFTGGGAPAGASFRRGSGADRFTRAMAGRFGPQQPRPGGLQPQHFEGFGKTVDRFRETVEKMQRDGIEVKG